MYKNVRKKVTRLSLKEQAERIAKMVRKLAEDNLNYNSNKDQVGLNVVKMYALQNLANEVAYPHS